MKYASLLCLLFAAGCASAPPAAKSEPTPLPVVEAPKVNEEPPVQVAGPKPGDNPRRINQLRELGRGTVTVNGKTFKVWLADDETKIQEGMMWLKPNEVKDDEGMLFFLPTDEPQRFWMRNCPMALDIIFLDRQQKILNIGFGKPFDESGVPSSGPSKYVLELKAGIAKKNGLKPGQKVEFQLPK